MIGHVNHGKTTLTAALTRVCQDEAANGYVGSFRPYADLDAAPEEMFGVTVNAADVEYETPTRHYAQTDGTGDADVTKLLLLRDADAAVLVVAVTDGPTPQTAQHLKLAREVGIPSVVVFLNKADMIEDGEMNDLVEKEVRDLLTECGYPGEDTPVVIGSARAALDGKDDNGMGATAVKKLLEALDTHVPTPVPATDKPALVEVQDTSSADGGGTIATGRVYQGTVKVQDQLEIVGLRTTATTTCTRIQQFREDVEQATTGSGDGYAFVLAGVKPADVERGQVLAKPGSATGHTKFTANAYIMTKADQGVGASVSQGYSAQFRIRTADVTGSVALPEGVETAAPGGFVQLTVTIDKAVAIEAGVTFTIHDRDVMVGAGRITKIVE
ncbi:GTP-binding protein [Streptomyces sp. NPDC059071]|uniref:GTP-binding protein n=1 Tax=unclassified Streptomyces TaxID=2593676 RepID=UPI003648CA8E